MFLKRLYENQLRKKVSLINSYLNPIKFKSSDLTKMYLYSVKGGKRFRPLIIILGCCAVKGDFKKIIPICCSFELLHKASLIHDDIIDEDNHRRGAKTFYKKYTKKKGIIMGDLLISLAFDMLITNRKSISDDLFVKCYKIFVDVFRAMAIGEMEEELMKETNDINETDIYEMHKNKTASFIGACFKVGALLGKGNVQEVKMLSEYGLNIGLAFQLINDLNNLAGLEKGIKSRKGNDLKNKRKSYPLIHLLRESEQKDRLKIIKMISKETLSYSEVNRLIRMMKRSKSVEYSKKLITGYLSKARESISRLRWTPTKSLLIKLTYESQSPWFWKS